MIKTYNGEMYIIPEEFEKEVREKILNELLENICDGKCDSRNECRFAKWHVSYAQADEPTVCGCKLKDRIKEIVNK